MSGFMNGLWRISRFGRVGALAISGILLLGAAGATRAADGVFTEASSAGPAQYAYAPPQAPAPVIVMLSGATGPDKYKSYAERLAAAGYYVVLIAGADVMTREQNGPANLRHTIDRALKSPLAVKGKTAIIAFSLGGGGALAFATEMPERVSVVIAHYPFTNFSSAKTMSVFVQRFKVPLLVLAAGRDNFKGCCLIESMREMEAAAKSRDAKFELVVYPQANHGFNLEGVTYRQEDAEDAWRRAQDMLDHYHPPKAE